MRLRQAAKPQGPIGAGARDRWVTIQGRPEDSTAGSGFPIDGPWTDLATVAMARDDLDAIEVTRANQEQSKMTVRWETAYRPDCDPERLDIAKLRRLCYRDRVYDVLTASMIGRRQTIVFVTEGYSKVPTETAVAP
jgi:SPP1 family predicted phage head-tail adaptor